jgi:hypothetical protein
LAGITALVAAALALEPLNLLELPDSAERREWTDLITHLAEGVSLDLADEEVDRLRKHLREYADYSRVAQAVRDPRGRLGQELLDSLRRGLAEAPDGQGDPEQARGVAVGSSDEGTPQDDEVPIERLIEQAQGLVAQARSTVDLARRDFQLAQQRDTQQRAEARVVLGVDDSTTGIHLWKAYQSQAAETPERDWELKDAYHLLHDHSQGSRTLSDARDRYTLAQHELTSAESDLAALLNEVPVQDGSTEGAHSQPGSP